MDGPRFYSRLMAHEFLIEVVLARALATASEQVSQSIKNDLVNLPGRLPPQSGPVDVEQLEAQARAVKSDLHDILRKVSTRENNIRALTARARQ